MAVRFFISQDVLDALVAADQASIDGERLAVPSRRLEARVEPAVYFVREVEGKPDPNGLVGKVKTEEALAVRGADHYRKSVILGDSAYDVVEGYLGTAAEGWVWPSGVAETPPVAAPAPRSAGAVPLPPTLAPPPPPDEAPAPRSAGTAPLPPTLAPPPPPDDDEDIPVDIDLDAGHREPNPREVREAAAGSAARRPSLPPDALRRIEASPGFRPPAVPPPETDGDDSSRQPPTRPPGGRPKLPTPAPAGARGSRPPPPPGARTSRPPPPSPPQPHGAGLESPGKTADELERLLLETIRPTRGKRR